MKKETFLVNFFDENGITTNTFTAHALEEAECFAIANIKAGMTNEATIIGYFHGRIIVYSNFKKEENS